MSDSDLFIELPEPPSFSDEDIAAIRDLEHAGHVFFEWLRYAGECAVFFSYLLPDSPAVATVSKVEYSVFIGHLHRCAKLTMAYLELAQNRKYGEATMVLDRCIFETSLRLIWLLSDDTQNRVNRYLASSVRADIKFRSEIEHRINGKGGDVSPIEERMLDSIRRTINSTGMSEEQIKSTKKLPPLDTMLSQLGVERLTYLVNQAIGSHAVHGTWTHLRLNYMDRSTETLALLPDDIDPHANNMATSALWILRAVVAFLEQSTNIEITSSVIGKIQCEMEDLYELFATIGRPKPEET